MKELGKQGGASAERPTKPVVYFSLGLTLDDIPPADKCGNCLNPTQKELMDFETEADSLMVVSTPVPGYGCINSECGIKMFDPKIFIGLLRGAAREMRLAGDIPNAELREKEADLSERILQEHIASNRYPAV